MTDTVDPGASYSYQNDNPRRPYLSSSVFSKLRGGFPRIMAPCGFMHSRGPPDHLPTGTPRSSSATLRVHRHRLLPDDPGNDPAWYYDTAGPTPTTTSNASGTGTQPTSTSRTQHRLLRRRCSGRHQGHPGGQHGDARRPLHRRSGALHRHPAPPGAVHLEPRLFKLRLRQHQHHHHPQPQHWTPSSPTPHPGCTENDNHGRKRSRSRSPRATPARPSLSTRPTSTKFTNSDTRDAYHHQPGRPKGRRPHCSGHRRLGIPRRQHNRERPGHPA